MKRKKVLKRMNKGKGRLTGMIMEERTMEKRKQESKKKEK